MHILENRIITSQINNLEKDEQPQPYIKEGVEDKSFFKYIENGYIPDVDENEVEDNLDENNKIISMLQNELVAAVAMSPIEMKDEEGNVVPWPTWCSMFVRERLDSIKEYIEENYLYKQCIEAKKEFPESVKSC